MPQQILVKLGVPPFKPLPFLSHGKTQTIVAPYFPYISRITKPQQHVITLPDLDKIVLVENRPTHWVKSQRIVLLVHGLTGSDQSTYIIRSTNRLLKQGFRVLRMNLRGAGSGQGLAKNLYHSGRSEDTRAALSWISTQYPNSPVTQIGFSLGGNITLKMAGEDGHKPSGNLDSIMAISPPLDLMSTVKLIIKKRNKIFNDYFVKGLLNDVKKLHDIYPELPALALSQVKTLYEFDDLYTAPRSGFKNAADYYSRCSAKNFIDNIHIPTFILYSKDDPVISRRTFLKLPKKNHFDTVITAKGGHVAWLGYTRKCCQYRWMDNLIEAWIKWFDLH